VETNFIQEYSLINNVFAWWNEYFDLSECNRNIRCQMRVQQMKLARRLVAADKSGFLNYLMPIDMLSSNKHWVLCTRPARNILTFILDACG